MKKKLFLSLCFICIAALQSNLNGKYEGKDVYIGRNVTNEAGEGEVVVRPATELVIDGENTVNVKNNFKVESGGTLNIK